MDGNCASLGQVQLQPLNYHQTGIRRADSLETLDYEGGEASEAEGEVQ